MRPLSSILWVSGLVFLFLGQRVLTGDTSSQGLSLMALLALGAAVIRQAQLLRQSQEPARVQAHRTMALSGAFGLVAILLFLLSSDHIGVDSDLLAAGWPILLLLSTCCFVLVEVFHCSAPTVVQPRRIAHVRDTAILIGLAIVLVFPLNHIAIEKNKRWDLTYFKTATAGTATQMLVDSLQDPVVVRIFQEPGSESVEELRAYFEPLEGPLLSVEVLDQAAEPQLVELLEIPDNGYVTVSLENTQQENDESSQEESPRKPPTESFQVSGEWDSAKRTLKVLDGKFHQALAEVVKGERNLYFTSGHMEMPLKGGDGLINKIKLVTDELKTRGYSLKELDRADLIDGVPDDASAVLILGAEDMFVEAELESLKDYQARGGNLLISLLPHMTDGADSPVATLLDLVGIEQENGVLADARRIVPTPPFPRPRLSDRVNIITGTFSVHPSTLTLSKAAGSRSAGILFPRSTALLENSDFQGKQTVVLRSVADNWMDTDTNLEKDTSETADIRNLAIAINGQTGDTEWKAAVFSSTQAFTDFWVRLSGGGALLLIDTVNWMTGTEGEENGGAGEIEEEKDPLIVHRSEDQLLWFYGTVFFVPLLVFGVGLLRLRQRQNSQIKSQEGGQQ